MAQWPPSPPGRAFCMLPPRQCLPSQGRSMVESTSFNAWESFYVIIGSSAAALTGLQFVVVVLGAEARSLGPEVGAFGTPTVVHFCAVLLMSAILSVPWRAVSHAGLSLAAVGVAGTESLQVVLPRGGPAERPRPAPGGWAGGSAPSPTAHASLPSPARPVPRGAPPGAPS